VSAVLLYDSRTDEILLNQQFRMGAMLAGADDPFLLECAGGMIDDGETPEDAARREAWEEAGCRVTDLEPVGICYPSAGSVDEKFHLFIGRIDGARAGHHGVELEGEEIRTHIFPAAQVIEMADAGLIPHGVTLICVHWFARHRERLRKKWKENTP
jgi:ADP-ribose pyrophosphatase